MRQRMRIKITGAVQGVGFRPFIYRLASESQLTGWVNNSPRGVTIEAEGEQRLLEKFLLRIDREKPPVAFIQSLEHSFLDSENSHYTNFEIRKSATGGAKTTLVLPDIATCPDCLREIFDPANRRYLYPFTNCTNCGPRFSIIESLPYDRQNTSMKQFTVCENCQAECENPDDRRFHAQPNACPNCGPHLELWDCEGNVLAAQHQAVLATADAIRNGKIVAIKGLGGFHLLVNASDENAAQRLRNRKHREEKPFAVMFPSLESIQQCCLASELEKRLLLSAESPIVLLHQNHKSKIENPKSKIRNRKPEISKCVAPNNPYIGALLPYTPLHHILMCELGFPVVATSGNLSDEPICIDEHEALDRLGNIADLFLIHNRPIVRQVDDSIARIMTGREIILRRARGYAPLPIPLKHDFAPTLAVGAHLKNNIALSVNNQVFISQHIGDLETEAAYRAFQNTINSFFDLYEKKPAKVVCDAHPDYLSTHYAKQSGFPVLPVQHHYAHILSCMAENELQPPVLGICWDGTGYGLDGTIWGGEFLMITGDGFERRGHFRSFPLPGGETAIKEPRRSALGMLYETLGETLFATGRLPSPQAFSPGGLKVLQGMLNKGINSPRTTSVGRIFDAVASLVNLRHINRFEGQAAMELEFQITPEKAAGNYDFDLLPVSDNGKFPQFIIDWEPMIDAILDDITTDVSLPDISVKFHNTLVEMAVAAAKQVGETKVALSGGCFQNKYLTERMVQRLSEEEFRPYWHQRVPPNDGGIALGQVVAANVVRIFENKQEEQNKLFRSKVCV